MEDPQLVGLRGDLRLVSRGLIGYGVVGLLVAGIGFGAMVWVNDRITEVRAEARKTVAELATTVEIAAAVLRGASTTAQSFSGTVEESAQAVSSAVGTISEVRSDLSAVESQLRSVNIFGATPLGSAADAVARIAASMEGLDTQVPLIAAGLEANRDALARNATALGQLSTSVTGLAARLDPSVGRDSLDDVQQVFAITLLTFAAWSFVPALGALVLGVWLGRQLRLSRSA